MDRVREQNRLRKQRQREREKLALLGSESYSHNMSRDNHATEVEEEVEIEVEEDITTATACKVDADYITFFNTNIHQIIPHEHQILKTYIENGLTAEVITLALQEAVEADARDMRYIKTVLDRWLQQGLKTVEEVKADKRQFKGKQKKKVNNHANSNGKHSTFNNYEQRTYDFKELEKKLLGWDG
jgi:DnaD/phage-associated family protein